MNKEIDNRIFCKIVKKQLSANIVYEDDLTLAFKDIYPQATTHILVIPKLHVENISSLKDSKILIAIFNTIEKVCDLLKITEAGFRIVSNNGKNAGQSVFHLHFHILSDTKSLSAKFN
jgi:histidine triad (HIT) family protein